MEKCGSFNSDSDIFLGAQDLSSPLPFSESSFGDFPSEREVILACDIPKKRPGRKKFRETRHPVYRGLPQRDSGKWVCELREPNKKSRIWLGTYATAEMAARAHDVAAIALRGRLACLNFAESTWRLSLPASLSTKDIQKVAAVVADAFSPRSDEFDQEAAEEVAEEIPPQSSESTREAVMVGEAFHRQSAEDADVAAAANAFWMEEEALFGMD